MRRVLSLLALAVLYSPAIAPGRASRGHRCAWRAVAILAVAFVAACESPTAPPGGMKPQSVVLFSTPKIIPDFDQPAPAARAFLEHYAPLTSRAAETILILAVGNSEHVLTYRGAQFFADTVQWARFTGLEETDARALSYEQIRGIVQAFRAAADTLGITLKVFDQVDSGIEFTREFFKLNRHPECFSTEWQSFDIRGTLVADAATYATAPGGITAGTSCGRFLADQVAAYASDLGFDGMLYGNQLGTRGRWQPSNGPGFTAAEAQAIRDFWSYSKSVLGDRDLMWFDTYWDVATEHRVWSVPEDAYVHFDYILAAGFAVVSDQYIYQTNLQSKLKLTGPKIIGTLDYVDPWYTYNSMTDFPETSAALERIAIAHRYQVDGLVFFANDHEGAPVPKHRIQSFAQRYFLP